MRPSMDNNKPHTEPEVVDEAEATPTVQDLARELEIADGDLMPDGRLAPSPDVRTRPRPRPATLPT